jgi:hypothetical protein
MTHHLNERNPGPVPADIEDMLMDELPAEMPVAERWAVERFVEYAYSSGYSAGHLRGYRTGTRDAQIAAAAGQPTQPTGFGEHPSWPASDVRQVGQGPVVGPSEP